MLSRADILSDHYNHEDVFVQRYERMLGWALQLAQHHRTEAEDLLHDAFIQFTITQPDLHAIRNLDAYLYGILRNLHLSQVRKATRARIRQLSVVEYESAESGLRSIDLRHLIQIQDELRRICQYVCTRKETARAASVLVLRFFHGYYPSEIALVLRTTPQAVKVRLRMARLEIKAGLEDPKGLTFMGQSPVAEVFPASFARAPEDLLIELRETIFRSGRGHCLAKAQIKQLYRSAERNPIDTKNVGHIVSCRTCLEEVNKVLGLPSLSDRHPTESLGNDKRKKGGPASGASAGSSGGAPAAMKKWRREAREVFEHDPQELCVSVNGYVHGSHKINSELCELALDIGMTEPIEFVEIFSEQQIRLALMSIDTQPPEGPGEKSLRVELSDSRALELQLRFGSPWPTLHVAYHDPSFKEAQALLQELAAQDFRDEVLGAEGEGQQEPLATSRHRPLWQTLKAGLSDSRLAYWRFWRPKLKSLLLQPAIVTAIVAVFLIAILLYVRLPLRAVSAAELLQRSAVAEEAVERNPDLALHRTVQLEERRNSAVATSHYRIEIWNSATRGVKLRRVYDEQSQLVFGEWTKPDGTSTVYAPGAWPQARTAAELAAKALLETGELWRLDVSAKIFSALVGHSEAVDIEQETGAYILSYHNRSPVGAVRLLNARLTLSKRDLHAMEETLVVGRDAETREYRFVLGASEQQPERTVAPKVFEPEPELLSSLKESKSKNEKVAGTNNSASSAQAEQSIVASRELEIEVAYLLNQVKANLGEQVNMSRTAEGKLRVEALVESEQRKQEILIALRPVTNNPAVTLGVQTVAEALKHQPPQANNANSPSLREVEVSSSRTAVDAELRDFFSTRVARDAVDEEIKRYSDRVMNHSRQALLHASALKRLVEKFSPGEAGGLEPQARAQLLSMIREQAQSYRREVASLRRDLRTVFAGLPSGEAESEIANEANLAQSVEHLVQLSYANDDAVCSAFTISADAHNAMAIKSPSFWRSLLKGERLAAAIQSRYQN